MKKGIFTSLLFVLTLITLSTFSQENYDSIINNTKGKSTYTLSLGHRFNVIENMLYFTSDMRNGDKIFISDLKGKRIFGYVHEMDISRIKLPEIAPGIYVVSKIRNGNLVNKNQVVMGVSSK